MCRERIAFASCAEKGGSDERLSTVLITLDTTRADVLGCYRGLPGITPNLDALAKECVVYDAARSVMHAGASCHDVHMAVSRGFHERGYHLGHVTGHSIGMTMIEFPKVGEGVEIELQQNMVLSMHPHAIAENGEDCLYMQDTWLVTPSGGVPLADLAMEIWEQH